MARPKPQDFDCPVCGEEVPGGSKSCPECGACEKSGWGDDTYLDGISLPDDQDPGSEFTDDEFRGSRSRSRVNTIWMCVAALLVILFLWPIIRSALSR